MIDRVEEQNFEQQVAEVLGENGRLAEVIDGFAPRGGQLQMSADVARCLHDKSTLITEAGTGIGKTFAYLVPALQLNDKVIISTGTKHLQDQLYRKDLPALARAMKLKINTAILKGRSNYLCPYRLDQALIETRRSGHQHFNSLRALDEWRHQTGTGDKVEFTRLAEDNPLWQRVTSTADNCLGVECPSYSDCFVAKSRRAAHDADLVVINHHLFFADLALKENGFGELLPIAGGIILDEAHQLPAIASRFFGQMFTSRRLLDLCKDTLAEARTEAPDMEDLFDQSELMPSLVSKMREAFGPHEVRQPWLPLLTYEPLGTAIADIGGCLSTLTEVLEMASERSTGLMACFHRAEELSALLKNVNSPSDDQIQWCETSRLGFALHCTPLDVADTFRKQINKIDSAWIFTSATLAVGEDFTHFTNQLGIDDAKTAQWDSPFKFESQSMLYVPDNLPEPSDRNFIPALAEEALPILKANPGGCFMLFTSYRALRDMQRALTGRTQRKILVQGEIPRNQLIDQFREDGEAILLATSGFWEGVDVRGQALSCVIIDKLPFAPPGDPVTEARLDLIKRQRKNPFYDYQIPQAVITLKQGVGRLLRDVQDSGLLMICDRRLYSKSYGRAFRESLPPAPVTRSQADAIAFLEQQHSRG